MAIETNMTGDSYVLLPSPKLGTPPWHENNSYLLYISYAVCSMLAILHTLYIL